MKRHLFFKKARTQKKRKIQLRMIYRKSSRANTYEWKFVEKIGELDEFSDHRLIGSLPSLICRKRDKMAVSQSRKKLTNIPPLRYTYIKLRWYVSVGRDASTSFGPLFNLIPQLFVGALIADRNYSISRQSVGLSRWRFSAIFHDFHLGARLQRDTRTSQRAFLTFSWERYIMFFHEIIL